MDIALITPTADRPTPMYLAKVWVDRMRACTEHEVHWLIADGGQEALQPQLGSYPIYYIRTTPHLTPLLNFKENMLALLERVEHGYDYIFVIEDDDWYAANYLSHYVAQLVAKKVELYGQGCARYYNLFNNGFRVHKNTAHASLSQTAFAPSVVPKLRSCIQSSKDGFFDMKIWAEKGIKKYVSPSTSHHVGMKALPGKGGIGYGHKAVFRDYDPDWRKLKEWMGQDYSIYRHLKTSVTKDEQRQSRSSVTSKARRA